MVARRAGAILAIAATALALAGCGGSTVAPRSYVRSVCMALGTWRNTIQSAAVALHSSGASSATRPVAKLDYQRFVGALVTATRRATSSLHAAGTPSVPGGKRIAQRLTHAFDRATAGLEAASSQTNAIRTDSVTDFELGVGAVNSQIRSGLEQIAHVSPGQSRQLRSAAAKEPACQLLAG